MLCWQAHFSLWDTRHSGLRPRRGRGRRKQRRRGCAGGRAVRGLLSGQLEPWVLGPGAVLSPPGPALKPRSCSAGSPELSLKPESPGHPPEAGGQAQLPLPAGGGTGGGWNPACCPREQLLLAQRQGTAGRSWERRLWPPPADTHAKAPPSLGHMSTKVGPEWAPSELCFWVLGQRCA